MPSGNCYIDKERVYLSWKSVPLHKGIPYRYISSHQPTFWTRIANKCSFKTEVLSLHHPQGKLVPSVLVTGKSPAESILLGAEFPKKDFNRLGVVFCIFSPEIS